MESEPQERPPGDKPYAVLLYYPSPVRFDPAALARRVNQRLPESEVRGGEGPTDPISVFHLGHMSTYAGGQRAPAQIALLYGGNAPPRESWAEDLQQTWDWPGAEAAAGACTDQVMVSDMLAAFLDRKTRLRLFQDVLWAVVKETSPAAIRWVSAGKLVDPAAFLQAAESGDTQALFGCAFNFRVFNIANHGPGEMVMDTRGLAELGLPDVQMHFNADRLEPRDVAPCLGSVGAYLFEHGDVIGDGHTVPGREPSEKWVCRHEMSIVGPEREVLDVDPGEPFAARTGRHRAATPGGSGAGATPAPGEAGGAADDPSVPLNAVIIPSLASILCLAESAKGEPLSREEVGFLVEQAPSMILASWMVESLAGARGYADVEPESAWDQWQFLRRQMERQGVAVSNAFPAAREQLGKDVATVRQLSLSRPDVTPEVMGHQLEGLLEMARNVLDAVEGHFGKAPPPA